MLHLGASSVAEADREIGDCARAIWQANPRQRLQLFLRGGGTIWTISQADIDEIVARYDCVEGRGDGIECPTWETNPSAEVLRKAVDDAIQEGSWHYAAFHGIGPACEWGGPVDGDAFIALLDHLVAKRGQVWNGTYTEIFKYEQERRSAKIDLPEASGRRIRLSLTSGCDPRLYDFPLTLRTQAPKDWQAVLVTQGDQKSSYDITGGLVMYDAVPGKGEILIEKI